jgi:hypothetical protein
MLLGEYDSESSREFLCERVGLVEHNVKKIESLIPDQQASHLEDIPNQALNSQASDFGAIWGEPVTCPEQDIVRQDFQLDQHLLRFETTLIAFGTCQTLLIFLDLDLGDPAGASY